MTINTCVDNKTVLATAGFCYYGNRVRQKNEKAKVVLINPENEILVLRRSLARDYRPGELDLPGGRVESGETPASAAIRETYEETGLVLGGLEKLGSYKQMNNGTSSVNHYFAANTDMPSAGIVLSEEHSEVLWTPRNDFLLRGEVPDKYLQALQDNLHVFDQLLQTEVRLAA